MKSQCATITSKGQVTIPSFIRSKLHLISGNKLEFIIKDGAIMVIPINKPVKNLAGFLPKPKKTLSIEEMNKGIDGLYDRHRY